MYSGIYGTFFFTLEMYPLKRCSYSPHHAEMIFTHSPISERKGKFNYSILLLMGLEFEIEIIFKTQWMSDEVKVEISEGSKITYILT